MKLTINTYRNLAHGYDTLAWATADKPLFVPPKYKGEKPQPWLHGVAVKSPCEHFRSGDAIDADVEWSDRLSTYMAENVRCEACEAPAEADADKPKPRSFRAKITKWMGRFGFAVPLRGEADDVDAVYLHGGSVCHHIATFAAPEYGSDDWTATVRRGEIVTLHDVKRGPRGYLADAVECDSCVADRRCREGAEAEWRAADAKRKAAEKRVAALFAKGHKFDVGGEYPYFVKSSDRISDVVCEAFLVAACKAVYEGAADDVVIAFAESEARKAYDARRNRHAEAGERYYEKHPEAS